MFTRYYIHSDILLFIVCYLFMISLSLQVHRKQFSLSNYWSNRFRICRKSSANFSLVFFCVVIAWVLQPVLVLHNSFRMCKTYIHMFVPANCTINEETYLQDFLVILKRMLHNFLIHINICSNF